MTAGDLYDMYQTNFPMLKPEDFERIVEEHHLLYDCEDDYDTTNQNFKPDEKEIDKEDDYESPERFAVAVVSVIT